jgi:UDP-N-acetylmuramate--alanine ligase
MIKNIQKKFILNLGFDFCPNVECRLIGFDSYPLFEKKIHIIGIGGIGMSGLAKIFTDKGYIVTGSDLCESEYTKGFDLSIGHDKTNIKPNQIIIYNDLIKEDNVERVESVNYNNLQLSRMETINLLLKNKTSIGITGCHGKTTTTSLFTYILDKLNPSFLIGGIPKNYNTNGRYTNSSYIVFELDESNKNCETIDMDYLIMTNINNDHIENYGSVKKLQETFNKMGNKIKDNLVYCGDKINKTDNLLLHFNFGKSYGFEEHNDYNIKNYKHHDTYSTFDICGKNEYKNIKVNLIGKHNV